MTKTGRDEINRLQTTINQRLAMKFASRITLEDLDLEMTGKDMQVRYRLHSEKDDTTLTKDDWIKAERLVNGFIQRHLRRRMTNQS